MNANLIALTKLRALGINQAIYLFLALRTTGDGGTKGTAAPSIELKGNEQLPLATKPGELDYFSADVTEPKDMTFELDDPGDDPKIVVYGRKGAKPNHVDYDARQTLDTR